MRTIITSFFICFISQGFSQDTLVTKTRIDSLVRCINTADLTTQRDTIVYELPDAGLKMNTYLTIVLNGIEPVKYINDVNSTVIQNGVEKKVHVMNTLYFNNNQLIKVEEYMLNGDKKENYDWYYWDNKSVYYTSTSETAAERASFLIDMSKEMMKQMLKQLKQN